MNLEVDNFNLNCLNLNKMFKMLFQPHLTHTRTRARAHTHTHTRGARATHTHTHTHTHADELRRVLKLSLFLTV